MLDEGASPQQVDAAIEAFGFAMGPFRMSDLAGNDIGWHIRKRRYVEQPEMMLFARRRQALRARPLRPEDQRGLVRLQARRSHGRSVAGRRRADRRRTAQTIKAPQPRNIDDDEIVDRLVFALVNEGAKILEEKIAQRASDIDVVYLMGYGFPALPRRTDVLRGHRRPVRRRAGACGSSRAIRYGDPAFWTPAPLLARLAAEGGSFNAPAGGAR